MLAAIAVKELTASGLADPDERARETLGELPIRAEIFRIQAEGTEFDLDFQFAGPCFKPVEVSRGQFRERQIVAELHQPNLQARRFLKQIERGQWPRGRMSRHPDGPGVGV